MITLQGRKRRFAEIEREADEWHAKAQRGLQRGIIIGLCGVAVFWTAFAYVVMHFLQKVW